VSSLAHCQKRHQCCIDLSTNSLRINNTEVPFLSEHELPAKAHRMGQEEVADELSDAAGAGKSAGVAGPSSAKKEFPGSGQSLGATPKSSAAGGTPATAPAASTAKPSFPEAHIESVSIVH
jgi:DNA damage-inducible protein 1